MNVQEKIFYLLDRYTLNQCTDEEKAELEMYMNSNQYDDVFEEHIEKNLRASSLTAASIDADRSAVILQRLRSKISQPVVHKIPLKRRMMKFAAAASVVIVLTAGFFIFYNRSSGDQGYPLSLQGNTSRERVNTGAEPMRISLEDGSEVVLQPAASLTYPPDFNGEKREVLLKGDAFFDIAKNPAKPFLVYHGHLITEVLGTSFTISMHDKKQNVEVLHGKVQVYENKAFAKTGAEQNKNNRVIITPNQETEYSEDQGIFNTSIVKIPLPVVNDSIRKEGLTQADLFNIRTGKLFEIKQKLQDTYGIEIVLDNPELNNCLFSGDISNQNLFEKLDILCKTMGISYSVSGTKIILAGKGCN